MSLELGVARTCSWDAGGDSALRWSLLEYLPPCVRSVPKLVVKSHLREERGAASEMYVGTNGG